MVSKTQGESMYGTYVTPEVIVVAYRSQGVLCQSVGGGHEGFDQVGDDFEI